MADKTGRGRIVWHELLTPDPGASHTFYSRVVGWKSQPWELDPSYRLFAASTGPLGGTVAQSEGLAQWRHYIEASDLDATTEEAVGLGATVQTPPTELPNGVRHAVLTDPQGATFCLLASTQREVSSAPKPGEFSWMELATDDVEAAVGFYRQLFGWQISSEHDMGPLGIYYLLGFEGRVFAGAFKKPPEMNGPSSWLGYVRVKDLDRAVEAATKSGATLVNEPMEVPGGDWIAQLVDPQGAMFAVHLLAADKKPVGEESATAVQAPETIEVTSAPQEVRSAAKPLEAARRKTRSKPAGRSAKAKATARLVKRKAAKKKAKVAAKTKQPARRGSVKSVKRTARKAVKVGKSKVKATPRRKKSAGKVKSRARAKARKSK